jgi:hypothetical protein
VAVAEDEHVGVGEPGRAPRLPPLGVAGLVDDGEADALDLGAGDLRQPLAERAVIVVAVHGEQPARAPFQLVQQGDVHPVTGVHDDVGGVDRGPQVMR